MSGEGTLGMAEGERLGPVGRRLAAAHRVLIVEDDHDRADRLRMYFRACGYDVVHVDPGSPCAVVAAVEEHRPTCVLLDLALRGVSGVESYRALRADRRWTGVPVVVMNARPDLDDLMRIASTDAVAADPCNLNILGDLVADRIDRAEAPAEATGTALLPDEPEESLSVAM
jgi:DNA-binding response OmpR family regulator